MKRELMLLSLSLLGIVFSIRETNAQTAPLQPVWTGVAMPDYLPLGPSPYQPVPPTYTQPSPSSPYQLYFATQFPAPYAPDPRGCSFNQHSPPSPYWFENGMLKTGPIYRNGGSVSTIFNNPPYPGYEFRGFEFLGKFANIVTAMEGAEAAIFYSDQPCYDGTLEYGFSRHFRDPSGGNLIFYYGENQNCPGGTCYGDLAATQPREGCASGFTFPTLPPSSDPGKYFFGAFVFQDPQDLLYKFFVQVLDGASAAPLYSCTVNPSAANPFANCPRQYEQNQCTAFPMSSVFNTRQGSITATVTRVYNGPGTDDNVVVLDLQGMFVAK